MPSNGTDTDPPDWSEARAVFQKIVETKLIDISFVLIWNHKKGTAKAYSLALSSKTAEKLLERCVDFARNANEAEFALWEHGFTAGDHNLLAHLPEDSERMCEIDRLAWSPNLPLGSTDPGKGPHILAMLLNPRDDSNDRLGAFYATVKAGEKLSSKWTALAWFEDRLTEVSEVAFTLGPIELAVTPSGLVVTRGSKSYQSVFGPLPEMQKEAAEVFDEFIAPLGIVNGEKLAESAKSDPRMMHKLLSIKAKMKDPVYAAMMAPDKVVAFVKANPQFKIPLDAAGKLVHDPSPQHRWDIFKLLDDDYLNSNLTERSYESNSKQQL